MNFKVADDRDAIIESVKAYSIKNAKSIEELVLELAECIKKDGSVKIDNPLKFIDEKDLTDRNRFIGLTNSGLNVNYPMNMTIGMKSARIIFEHLDSGEMRVYPSNRDTNFGHSSQPWKDAYVGQSTKLVNGYSKMTNGLIEQWGRTTIPKDQSFIVINMPISYSDEAYSVVASPRITEQFTYTSETPLGVVATGKGQIKISTWSTNKGRVSISWRAIGW